MDEYITRAEHTEFCARLDAENNRQNRRIEILEGTTKANFRADNLRTETGNVC